MKKINGFSMAMKKISSGLAVIGILKENQLKDKYLINKWKMCNKKKDVGTFLSSNLKVRGILSVNLAINIKLT